MNNIPAQSVIARAAAGGAINPLSAPLHVQASQSALAQNQRSSHNSSALESRNNHPAGCGPQCRPRDREWATLTARR